MKKKVIDPKSLEEKIKFFAKSNPTLLLPIVDEMNRTGNRLAGQENDSDESYRDNIYQDRYSDTAYSDHYADTASYRDGTRNIEEMDEDLSEPASPSI